MRLFVAGVRDLGLRQFVAWGLPSGCATFGQVKSLRISIAFALLAGSAVAGCGTAGEPPAVWDVELGSSSGAYQATFHPEPDPPIVGDNLVHVEFSEGATVNSLAVGAWMPAHGHGTPEDPVVAETGAGTYDVSKINYVMPGGWELTFDVDGSAGPDQFVLSFDVH